MMQSGQDLCGDDGPRSLDGSSSRRVLAQPQVRARLIVVDAIFGNDSRRFCQFSGGPSLFYL
jgi:hypothetical protein